LFVSYPKSSYYFAAAKSLEGVSVMSNLRLVCLSLLILAISTFASAQTSPTESKTEKEKLQKELEIMANQKQTAIIISKKEMKVGKKADLIRNAAIDAQVFDGEKTYLLIYASEGIFALHSRNLFDSGVKFETAASIPSKIEL